MKARFWRTDSLARRFFLTVVAAVVCTQALIGLFVAFGGNLAEPPIEKSGVLERAVDVYRVIDAVPASARPGLAPVMSDKVSVMWFAAGSPVALALDGVQPEPMDSEVLARLKRMLGNPQKLIPIRREGQAKTAIPVAAIDAESRGLAVTLSDGSWLVYSASRKLWGLPLAVRWTVWTIFLLAATGVVSLIAAGQLVRPIGRLTGAIRLFGTNPQAPPIAETGPVELRGVTAAFNTMQEQIQRLMSARTAMLAAISHDLRTPLTRIRLRGEFIGDQVQQARLFRDVDDLQQMIDGALAFFRGDSHQEAMTTLDLPSLLQTIVDDFSDHGVPISYSGPSRLAFLGRPVALKRAVANLVENAVKYGSQPALRLSAEASQAIITVTDRGPGIPEDMLKQVFHPFYRLEKSRSRTTGGVGLGLTAAQSIVREHGGEVTLTNLAEGGLEARVTLPVPLPIESASP